MGFSPSFGTESAAAQQKLLSGLALPSNINLTTFDPIAATKGGDAAGATAYVALAKVYDTVAIIATALSGVGVSFSKAYADAFNALDSAINALPAGQTLNLDDKATITSLISGVSRTENVTLTSAATVATAIVASNAGLDQALAQDGAGPTLLADVATVQTWFSPRRACQRGRRSHSASKAQRCRDTTIATFTDANPNAKQRALLRPPSIGVMARRPAAR